MSGQTYPAAIRTGAAKSGGDGARTAACWSTGNRPGFARSGFLAHRGLALAARYVEVRGNGGVPANDVLARDVNRNLRCDPESETRGVGRVLLVLRPVRLL